VPYVHTQIKSIFLDILEASDTMRVIFRSTTLHEIYLSGEFGEIIFFARFIQIYGGFDLEQTVEI
jgi:hypothetical protein